MINKDNLWFTFSALSSVASVLLMCIIWFGGGRHSPTYVVFWMSLGDLLASVNQILAITRSKVTSDPMEADSAFCMVTFILQQLGGSLILFWYLMMALNVLLLGYGWKNAELATIRPFQHAVVWAYALCSVLIPLINNSYAPLQEAHFCWFPNPDDPRRLLIYGPAIFTLLFCVFLVFFMKRRSHQLGLSWGSDPILRRLSFMVLVFFIIWGLAIFSRVWDALGGPETNLFMIAVTLNGVCNFTVWGLTHKRAQQFLKLPFSIHTTEQEPTDDDDMTRSLIYTQTGGGAGAGTQQTGTYKDSEAYIDRGGGRGETRGTTATTDKEEDSDVKLEKTDSWRN